MESVWNHKRELIEKCYSDNDFEKSWSKKLQKEHPNGRWVTINGAKVFIDGKGNQVAGADGKKIVGGGGSKSGGSGSKSGSKNAPRIAEVGDAVLYGGKTWYVRKEKGVYGLASSSPTAAGIDGKFIPMTKLKKRDSITTMAGSKVTIPKDESDAKRLKKDAKGVGNIFRDDNITLDTFKKIAQKAKTPKEFIEETRKIKNVPLSVSNEFSEKYGGGTMEQAAKKFMDDVKGGGSDSKKDTPITDKDVKTAIPDFDFSKVSKKDKEAFDDASYDLYHEAKVLFDSLKKDNYDEDKEMIKQLGNALSGVSNKEGNWKSAIDKIIGIKIIDEYDLGMEIKEYKKQAANLKEKYPSAVATKNPNQTRLFKSEEDRISKSIDAIDILKGRKPAVEGEIRTWSGKEYKKVGGEWTNAY